MNRVILLVLLALFSWGALSGCKKKEPEPVKPAPVTPTKPPDPVKPPDPEVDAEGWVASTVPPAKKDIVYATVFKVIKVKDQVFIRDLHKSETENAVWKIVGGDLEKEFQGLPDDGHIFVKVQGRRIWERRWVAPQGYTGEKHEYTMQVEKVQWKMPPQLYDAAMDKLESDVVTVYQQILQDDPRLSRDQLNKLQEQAEELGYGIDQRVFDARKRPFSNLTDAVTNICRLMDAAETRDGGVQEVTALLQLYAQWNHFPPNPVTGHEDKTIHDITVAAKKSRIALADAALKERIRAKELKLKPEDAPLILAATDPTLTHRFAEAASNAGDVRLGWACFREVFTSKADAEWKQTSLSALLQVVRSKADYFDAFSEEELKAYPQQLSAAVTPFAKGTSSPARNASNILLELEKRKPGMKWDPPISKIIDELKKK